jgi:hypothetical protein
MDIITIVVVWALFYTLLHVFVSIRVHSSTFFGVGHLPDVTPFPIRIVVLLSGIRLHILAWVVRINGNTKSGGTEEQDAHKDLSCSTHD